MGSFSALNSDMDSSSILKSSLPPPYRPPSSLKGGAPQDESSESASQLFCSAIWSSSMSPALQCLVPPPPPPLPPALLGARRDIALLSGRFNWKFRNSLSGLCVPKETVHMWDRLFEESFNADVTVYTDDGGSFTAHSIVLVSASPVFKNLLEVQWVRKGYKISITGVPSDAAKVFVRFLYSSRCDCTVLEKYILHLVVLSHVYGIPALKKLCTYHFEQGFLTSDNVIDVLQLSRLCDIPRLNMLCLRLIIRDFKGVAKTEGWRVMRESDPILEQELVEAVIEADCKRQEKLRKREEEKVYGQLRDAMEALVHICRDGCRTIGPHDKIFDGKQQGPCKYPACKGLESLVRHFAGCRMKVSGGCVHCKRMWQLLELHSRMCQETDCCKVPLCRHFKEKLGQQSKKEEQKWRLLVSKVMAAKSSVNAFSLATVSARLEQV
eukprot:c23693_g1_i1 orf=554-1867(+)